MENPVEKIFDMTGVFLVARPPALWHISPHEVRGTSPAGIVDRRSRWGAAVGARDRHQGQLATAPSLSGTLDPSASGVTSEGCKGARPLEIPQTLSDRRNACNAHRVRSRAYGRREWEAGRAATWSDPRAPAPAANGGRHLGLSDGGALRGSSSEGRPRPVRSRSRRAPAPSGRRIGDPRCPRRAEEGNDVGHRHAVAAHAAPFVARRRVTRPSLGVSALA